MQGFGGEGQLHHFNHHHSNRNISYGDHWLLEVVVDSGGSFVPVQSIMYCVSVSAFQAFRGHPNCHRGRIGPGRVFAARSAAADHPQPKPIVQPQRGDTPLAPGERGERKASQA